MALKVRKDGVFVSVGGGGAAPWVRPPDWLTLPTVGDTEQKFVGLYAVTHDDSNYLAIRAEGAYTVDWGDGSGPEDVASGVQAVHHYDYATLGNLSSRGYKQVIVTLTPQVGQNLTLLSLNERPSVYGTQLRNMAWLDVAFGSPNLTSLMIGSSVYPGTSTQVAQPVWLEQVTIKSHAVTNMSRMFFQCYSLQSVPLFGTGNVWNMGSMFHLCTSLQVVPLFDTSAVTDMNYMFGECYSLQSVPLFDTSAVTNMGYMFFYCYSLQSVPLFNTPNLLYVDEMFESCYCLQSMPLWDTSLVEAFFYMFRRCYSLQSVAPLDVSGAWYTGSHVAMFGSCRSLASAPLQGTKYDISYLNCKLSRAALVAIFNGLADLTALTGRTITITGNLGITDLTSDDRAIATNKNWAIVE